MTIVLRTALVAVMVAVSSRADAQIYELVGTRAQGMGGAFVAVADDATATWWNPAGLATGAYFSGIVERGLTTEPPDTAPGGPAWEARISSLALVFPAFGVSYYRLRVNEIAPTTSTDGGAQGRQDPGVVGVRSLSTRQFGWTVGQSLGNHLVIGSTLRLIRGGFAHSDGPVTGDPLDAADELDVSTETKADIDLGAVASFGPMRFAVAVKHVREPEFGEDDTRFVLQRQARAGLAFTTTTRGPLSALTFGLDADLTKTPTAFGDARHVAAGLEAWLLRRRVGLRGGVSANTVGDANTSTSVGGSLAARQGLYVDGAATFGSDRSREGWSVGLRLTY
jgi:hypothetical protein